MKEKINPKGKENPAGVEDCSENMPVIVEERMRVINVYDGLNNLHFLLLL